MVFADIGEFVDILELVDIMKFVTPLFVCQNSIITDPHYIQRSNNCDTNLLFKMAGEVCLSCESGKHNRYHN